MRKERESGGGGGARLERPSRQRQFRLERPSRRRPWRFQFVIFPAHSHRKHKTYPRSSFRIVCIGNGYIIIPIAQGCFTIRYQHERLKGR
ncbi:hypothetical protein Hanom_Chr04g00293171 [Helianthus anomalus]